MEWLDELMAEIPTDLHWVTRRRMAYMKRIPPYRQQEALIDNANGDGAKLLQINLEIAAIKQAIPKDQ